jgi:hypothetical protein
MCPTLEGIKPGCPRLSAPLCTDCQRYVHIYLYIEMGFLLALADGFVADTASQFICFFYVSNPEPTY